MDTVSLAPEIIKDILKYLTFKQRKRAALVSKSWYYASMHPMFIKNELFSFEFLCFKNIERNNVFEVSEWLPSKSKITNNDEELKDFVKTISESKRKILNIKFIENTSLQLLTPELFRKRGQDIKSLYFSHNDYIFRSSDHNISINYLTIIMFHCRNLETLSIDSLQINNLPYQYSYTSKISAPQVLFPKLKYLNLNNTVLPNSLFKILMKQVPNLYSLCLNYLILHDSMETKCHKNYKYSKITATSTIINYLETAQNITNLLVDTSEIFLNMPAHIQLTDLKMDCFQLFNLDVTYLKKFQMKLETQRFSLRNIILENIPCCSLAGILALQNLESIKIKDITINKYKKCSSNVCIPTFLDAIGGLKHLKTFSIWSLHSYNSLFVYNFSLFVFPQRTIRLLRSLDCLIYNVADLLNYGENLVRLTIFNGSILSTDHVSLIFEKLINLKYLQIDNCLALQKNMLSELPISNLRDLSTLKISGGTINQRCLRSIKHSNLKTIYFDKVLMDSGYKLLTSVDWSAFEITMEMLAASVPNLTSLTLYYDSICTMHFERDFIVSCFKSLELFDVQPRPSSH